MTVTSQKINMLFEASCLAKNFTKDAARTGQFFVAYNLLKQFYASGKFNIVLYLPALAKNYLPKFRQDNFFSNFEFFVIDDGGFINNIKVHKMCIAKTKNPLVVFIRLLKIIKNYFRMVLFYFCSKNKNIVDLKDIDVFFSPVDRFPEFIKDCPHIKRFIVLHDAIPLLDNLKLDWYDNMIASLDRQTWCFCVSAHTLHDFLAVIPERLDENKMTAVHIAAARQFTPTNDKTALRAVLKKYGIRYNPEDSYIFSLCNIDPRKNLLFTAACFIKFIQKHKIDNLYFYLGGPHFDSFISEFNSKFKNLNDINGMGKIIRLGYIDDEDVNILYSHSIFFTYLSKYEGFGMPPLEAMQAGTPVITSNNSSMPEVAGDAAIMIDCDSEEQCIKAFEDLYFNEGLRQRYIQKGIERGKIFSWEKTADKMMDIMLKSLQTN